jgi:ribosomal protein L10
MTEKRPAPKEKIKDVKELAELFDSHNTVLFASIKSLPSKQLQKIKKGIADKVIIKVVKKNILRRAIESSKRPNINKLAPYIIEDNAILISQLDAFELAGILAENKSPVKAKIGQIAEMDIVIEPGPTELIAGPVVSELGVVGLKIEIKGGKIEIKEQKTIVKKGQAINESATSIMSKLNILPFSVGFIPMAAYDSKSEDIFTSLIIDKEGTLKTMKNLFAKATSFAVSLGYVSKETISYLFSKAVSHERAIAALIKDDTPQTEIKTEEEIQ